MEIVEGIHQVDGVNGNVYLIVDNGNLTLIDTGFIRSEGKILDHIKKLGFEPSAVSTIILTHYHIDHTGNAKKLKEKTGAKVAVHEADADFVRQKKAPPKPKSLLSKAAAVIKPAPVEPDIVLKDGDTIGGLQVVHVPGHTPGSIALFDEKRKAMFMGDTAFFEDGKIEGPVAGYTCDMALAEQSLGKLAGFDFEVMLSGHEEPLTSGASKKIKEYVETLKKQR